MGKHLICPDVSEFQRPLGRDFTRDFVIFRVTFGAHYPDPKFLANANAAKRLYDQGRIAGVLLYVVYTKDPVKAQFESTWHQIGPHVPAWLTGIMIDVETWRGQRYALHGDHSKRINALYGMHAHRLGNWNSVIAYGNAGDLHELYPGRDKRCRVIVASYGSQLSYRKVRGAIGQQYSDGQSKYPVPRLDGRELPRASAPFGRCDHNVFPGIATGRDLVKLLRPEQLRGGHPAAHPPAHPPAKPAPPRAKPTVRPPAKPAARPPAKPPVKAPAKPVAKPPAAKPPIAAAPAPPATRPATVVLRNDTLTSRNGKHVLVLTDDGTLEMHHQLTTTAITGGQ